VVTKSRQRPKNSGNESRGNRNADWIEQHCYVPEGKLVGQPVELRDWQRREICRIYDNPAGTRRAILSFGRKNGKTALASFLLILHLVGPESRVNSQLYSTAQSRDQAAILFALAAKTIRISPTLRDAIVIRDTAKQLACPDRGTLYRALSADASTAYGLSPVFIVHDELGQVKGPRSELYEALETATGAQENPLSIIISTQAPTDADLLSLLLDDALAGNDPRVVASLYSAPTDGDPFSEQSVRAANPAFGDFMVADEVMAMAADASRIPSRENEFRNLILNQRVEASSPFISQQLWSACGTKPESLAGVPVYAGLDLSEVRDLTALVMIGQVNGVWQVHPIFWLPGTGLAEKSRADHVPYDVWKAQDQVVTTPGKSVDYAYVAAELRGLVGTYNIVKIAFDRWNFRHFKPWLLQAGFTEKEVTEKFVEFGQGFQSMSPALRDLESTILDGKLAHGNHPVLSMCAKNSVVQKDPAGNRKLTKARSSGRIDGMVALAMALGAAPQEQERKPQFQMLFV
jgi:phage terminase large subunit-like protein